MNNHYFIFDFDSTFVQIETLEELARIALETHPDKEQLLERIAKITRDGMEGTIPFQTSLDKRLALFKPSQQHIATLIQILKRKISQSIRENKRFFRTYHHTIYIISGGFKEYIIPIVQSFGIPESHVIALNFTFDKTGNVIGYNKNSPLLSKNGKAEAIKRLHLAGKVTVIGDGSTDLMIKKSGVADTFFAYTENVLRKSVVKEADRVIPNLDELLFQQHLPRRLSYPKNRIRVLLLDHIHPLAKKSLEAEGFTVEAINHHLSDDELRHKLAHVSILGVRTKTAISKHVLSGAEKLLAIGIFSIGIDHIDLSTARHQGIAVFNAPYSNTRSVVEMALGEIILLSRNVIDKHTKLHQGVWDKSNTNSHEVRGKTLGIIGYGNIGSQLSILAEQIGMRILYFDITDRLPMGNAKRCQTLEELLKKSDVISIHIAGGRGNRPVIGEREFSLMKDGVIFLNLSRGSIVDEEALAEAIKMGKVGGAGIDVFAHEPKSKNEAFKSKLMGLPNVFLTPHVGGSTEEAQQNIAEFVSGKLIQFINTGSTMMSVNFPNLRLPDMKRVHRFIHIHHNMPGVLAQINSIMAKEGINVLGQYLGTNEDIGYVISDVNKTYDQSVVEKLRVISETIRLRVLY